MPFLMTFRTSSNTKRVAFKELSLQLKLTRFLDQNLLACVFTCTFFLQIPLLFGRYDLIERVKYFSQDEFAFVQTIMRYQNHLVDWDLVALFTETMDHSYGFVFYLTYAVVTLPSYFLGGELGVLAAGRFTSAVFQSLTFVWLVKLARLFQPTSLFLLIYAVAMALTPVFLIVHKPLSAEQISIFILTVAASKLIVDSTEKVSLTLVACCVGLSLSIKLNGALEGLFFALMVPYVLFLRGNSVRQATQKTIFWGLTALVVFAAANTPVIFSESSRAVFFGDLLKQFASAGNSQRGAIYYSGIADWMAVISEFVGNIWLTAALISMMGGASFLFFKLRLYGLAVRAFAMLTWVIVPTAFCLVFVQKAWIWYLSLPALFALMVLPMINGLPRSLTLRVDKPIVKQSLTALSYVLLATHIAYAVKDYETVMAKKWSEVAGLAYIEMNVVSDSIYIRALKKNYTFLYSDRYDTLPSTKLASQGIRVVRRYPLEHTLDDLLMHEPDMILVNFAGYRRHLGQKSQTIEKFSNLLSDACERGICYEKFSCGTENHIVVYERVRNRRIASNKRKLPIASTSAVYSGDSKDTATCDWAPRL